MKKTVFLFPMLLVLGSCSITQKTSSSYSLQPKLQQLTTVYELEVAPESVRRDTSWTSGTFYTDKTPVNGVKSIITAEIVEKAGADVLVEPKYSLKTINHLFSKDYYLSVEGYPAKFVNFHTASPEEYDMLYGKRVTDLPARPIDRFKKKLSFRADSPSKVRKAKVVKPAEDRYTRRTGFRIGVDLGLRAASSKYDTATSFQGDLLLGRQFNKNWYVGGGLTFGEYKYYSRYNHNNKYSEFFGGIFANGRCYIGGHALAPFVDARLGFNINGDGPIVSIRPAVGLSYKAFELSFGPDILVEESTVFTAKVGIRF